MANNNRKFQNRALKGYVASLTPQGQVHKVLTDISNLKDGQDLCNWSASARKELKAAPAMPFQVGKDKIATVNVPKLAVIIASPVVRKYFQEKPSATTAKFVHPDIKLRAMRSIAQWLEKVTNDQSFPQLEMPEDIEEALELRLTAWTLGMECYTKHFEVQYLIDVRNRVPAISELVNAVYYAREDNDTILVGLANRVAYLRRYHKISDEEEAGYAELLVDAKYQCLLDVVNHKRARNEARRGAN